MSLGKHLVIIGAGHAHLMVLARCEEYIKRGHEITVISPSPYQYYSGMGPGMLSGLYRPQDIRFNIRKLVESQGATFIDDAVVAIDVNKRTLRLSRGSEVVYDVASFNIGSTVALERLSIERENVFPVKPITNLLKARHYITKLVSDKTPDILVIGGGPSGLEIAGNAWRLVGGLGRTARITIVPGRRLLNGFPDKAYRLARASLEKRGIAVLDGVGVSAIEDGSVRLSTGKCMAFDACFVAIGVEPPPLFRDTGLPSGKTGGLLVNVHLQSVERPELFCGGDCVDLKDRPLAKIGVYAVRENPILFHNILAALENKPLKVFRPQKRFLLIFNLGDDTGLLLRGDVIWRSRIALRLKNYIDRKFMKTYQLSGERSEVE
jgi:NADH dehydrogenase FAD-containing subunit